LKKSGQSGFPYGPVNFYPSYNHCFVDTEVKKANKVEKDGQGGHRRGDKIVFLFCCTEFLLWLERYFFSTLKFLLFFFALPLEVSACFCCASDKVFLQQFDPARQVLFVSLCYHFLLKEAPKKHSLRKW